MEWDVGVTCDCKEGLSLGKGNLDSLNKTCLEVYIVFATGSKHRKPFGTEEYPRNIHSLVLGSSLWEVYGLRRG